MLVVSQFNKSAVPLAGPRLARILSVVFTATIVLIAFEILTRVIHDKTGIWSIRIAKVSLVTRGHAFDDDMGRATRMTGFTADPMHWDWTWRVGGGLALCTLAMLVSRALHGDNTSKDEHRTSSALNHAEQLPPHALVPPEVTPEQLLALSRDGELTALQAEKAVQRYVGTWMRYSGTISDVSGDLIVFCQGHSPFELPLLFAHFDEKWREQLSVLPRGKLVKVEGQITEIGHLTLRLDHSELIE